MRELLDASELATQTVSAQRRDLQRNLEMNEREKRELQERVKTAETAAESAQMQLGVFQQQLESTKEEKTEIQELLKSTAGATETISILVVDLQKQLDQKAQTIKSLELQVAQARSAPRVNSNGLLVNGTGESDSASSHDESVGPAVRQKFTKLYRAYERERNLRKESQAQLAKTEEQRLNVAKTLDGIKQELSESRPAEGNDQESQPVSQFADEKRELSEKIAALHTELLAAQQQTPDTPG